MFYDANIGERCETGRTWIRTTKRHYGLSRRNSELNEFTNYSLYMTTNIRLVVIKKFVNSFNSLLNKKSPAILTDGRAWQKLHFPLIFSQSILCVAYAYIS